MTYTEPEVLSVLLVNFVRKVFSCRLGHFILFIKNVKYSCSLSFNQICEQQYGTLGGRWGRG